MPMGTGYRFPEFDDEVFAHESERLKANREYKAAYDVAYKAQTTDYDRQQIDELIDSLRGEIVPLHEALMASKLERKHLRDELAGVRERCAQMVIASIDTFRPYEITRDETVARLAVLAARIRSGE